MIITWKKKFKSKSIYSFIINILYSEYFVRPAEVYSQRKEVGNL